MSHRRFRADTFCFPCAYGAVRQKAQDTAFFAHRRAGRGTGSSPSHELQAHPVSGRGFRSAPVWRIAPAGAASFRDRAPVGDDRHCANAPRGQGGRSPLGFSPRFCRSKAGKQRLFSIQPGKSNQFGVLGKRFFSYPISLRPKIAEPLAAVPPYGSGIPLAGKRGSPKESLAWAWFSAYSTGSSVLGRSASPAPMALSGKKPKIPLSSHTAGLVVVRGHPRHTSCRRIR